MVTDWGQIQQSGEGDGSDGEEAGSRGVEGSERIGCILEIDLVGLVNGLRRIRGKRETEDNIEVFEQLGQ